MLRPKNNKDGFKRDEKGRVILGSAKEMAEWVKLGFEKQNFIDLANCILYISYPIGCKEAASQIFNLCDMAGIVPGIKKIEGDTNYLYEVTKDIHLDGSVLYGNFFHNVKFDGIVRMDDATVIDTFSCFNCLFQNYVYMQKIHITGRCDFEQCVFKKGLVLTGGKATLFHFNYSTVEERFSLASVKLTNHHIKDYDQSIQITNSTVENLNLSAVNTDSLPIIIGSSKVIGLRMDNVSLDNALFFESYSLDGIMTLVKDEKNPNNRIKELVFHNCEAKAQFHIENSDIDKFAFIFGKVDEMGRIRLAQCKIDNMDVGSSSVFGQIDLIDNVLFSIGLEETCVRGYLSFQNNIVTKYKDRQTLRLLKREALKVNDHVEATKLYAKEMDLLLADKSVSVWDKCSLWLNKLFSDFGESWSRALFVTLSLSLVLTLLMLGFGSSKYGFNLSGEFMGMGAFITTLLDSINVFSIPLFSDTIKEYGLNVFGQILYFIIKVVVASGVYQFVLAFRKYGRS